MMMLTDQFEGAGAEVEMQVKMLEEIQTQQSYYRAHGGQIVAENLEISNLPAENFQDRNDNERNHFHRGGRHDFDLLGRFGWVAADV